MRKNFDYSALLGEGNPLLRYPRLLEAAIDEFAMRRYEDASLNDILKKSGMSKGSLYHHFGDKFGLYLAMMDIIVQKKISYFYPLMSEKLDTGDFFGTLKQVMKATLEFMLADERMHHLSVRVMEENLEFRQQVFDFFVHDYFQIFSQYIHQAMESGQIDTVYPPELVAKFIEIVLANLDKLATSGDPDKRLETANQVVDIIQHGISSK
ncbi:MAG: TetR/AcrR family transcriptional regulator [Bacillota bacterium]|nr:TetR/AcrR family transcriptional regulator [Candidatus Fermentithermobacillaceae bacterium]